MKGQMLRIRRLVSVGMIRSYKVFAILFIVLFIAWSSPRPVVPALQVDVCIFDSSIRDISGNQLLQFNSSTGCYRWTSFRNGLASIVVSGQGRIIQKGCIITLQSQAVDHRLVAQLNTHTNIGTASIQIFSLGVQEVITQRGELFPQPINFGIIMPLYRDPDTSGTTTCSADPLLPDIMITDRGGMAVVPLSNDWRRAIAAYRRHQDRSSYPVEFWVVINPSCGPHSPDEKSMYGQAIKILQDEGIHVLGYVYTRYAGQPTRRTLPYTGIGGPCYPDGICPEFGTGDPEPDYCRTIEKVKNDIEQWACYSTKPDGIFLDEMAYEEGPSPNLGKTRYDYYSDLTRYAREKGFENVVGNQGSLGSQSGKFAGSVDTIIIYEKDMFPKIKNTCQRNDMGACIAPPITMPPTIPCCDYELDYSLLRMPRVVNKFQLGVLAHHITNLPDAFSAEFVDLRNHVKYIYATSDGVGDVWDDAPCITYLDKLFCILGLGTGAVIECQ